MTRDALKASSRTIHGHGQEPVSDTLSRIAAWCRDRDVAFDAYGTGELIQEFETTVADLLGFPASRFMPSGTLAQQAAMRIWADRSGVDHFAMHPTAHLELHEDRGYAHLHGLKATTVGPEDSPMLAEHLEELYEGVAALLIELPTREAGGLLPSFDELDAIKKSARDREFKLHLDGARLWECGPAYQRDYAEICEGFDSVYVSFYKGIGALPGAMLLGPEDFIAEAAVWQRRSGGNLFNLTPNVASAAMQFEDRLARMPAYLERAREVAATLSVIDGIRLKPDPPHVNMFHLYLDADAETALEARDRVAEHLSLWAFSWVAPSEIPGVSRTELYVGDAAMNVEDSELDEAFRLLMSLAAGVS
ncbi:MAG TPA: beta-eliminating lyase-related protein [Acidimicrobiia bacterium]